MRKMLMVGFLGLFTLAGCGSAAVVANPDAKFPVAATDDAPAFLFPINLSHAGLKASGDPTKALAMSVSVTGQSPRSGARRSSPGSSSSTRSAISLSTSPRRSSGKSKRRRS